jgi:hypothetical protein
MPTEIKPVIKNHKNKNRYVLTNNGLWVRDLTRTAHPVDINNLIASSDYDLILHNEMKNSSLHLASIDAETIFHPYVVIVSDGYDFVRKQELLKKLPQDRITVIGTNKSLSKWKMPRRMDWFVANNPYEECMSMTPNGYYPRGIFSCRTNPEFVSRYRSRSVVYTYVPVGDGKFSSNYFSYPQWHIDDYRNPICAAISLSFRWGVQKLLLFCCDDSFKDERPGAEQLDNDLFQYPQQNIPHGILEGMMYWLVSQKHVQVQIANHSSGREYRNAPYINEEQMLKFFD